MILYLKQTFPDRTEIQKILCGLFTVHKRANVIKFYLMGVRVLSFKRKIKTKEIIESLDKKISKQAIENQRILKELATVRYRVSKTLNEQHLSLTIAEQHSKVIMPYKDLHKGGTAVVVATGPTSLHYKPIQGAVHLGMNTAHLMDHVNLDYWFAVDILSIRDHLDGLNSLKCPMFFGQCADIWYDSPSYYATKLDNVPRFIPDTLIDKYPNGRKFYFKTGSPILSRNIGIEPFYNFCSVAFSVLTFAIWLGCKKIYLVGCDCALNGYFTGSEQPKEFDANNMLSRWKDVAKGIKLLHPDLDIISVNPIGLKGLFHDVYTPEYLLNHPELEKDGMEVFKI